MQPLPPLTRPSVLSPPSHDPPPAGRPAWPHLVLAPQTAWHAALQSMAQAGQEPGALALCGSGLSALEAHAGRGLQGLIVDHRQRLLHPRWPLWDDIAGGRGLSLQLWQRQAPGHPWQCTLRCHAEGPARPEEAASALAGAVAWLVEHAAWDGPLPAAGGPPLQPLPPARRHRLRGAWLQLLRRLRAQFTTEAWRIGIVDAPVHAWLQARGRLPVRWLAGLDSARCHADPMGVPGNPRVLLCETFDERTGMGTIERLTLDTADRIAHAETLPLDHGHHVSYPMMVEGEGACWGVLESAARRECVLHRVDGEGRWQRVASLLGALPVADSTLFRHEGRWWLATTDLRIGARDNLCLYHASEPTGPWTAHRRNPVKLDVQGSRMGGPLFRLPEAQGGHLVRPGQDCRDGYGRGLVLHQIVRLSPTEFEERRLARLGPEVLGERFDGMHTVCAWGERTLIDAKREVVHPAMLWRKLRARLGLAPARPPADRVCVFIPHLRLGGGETTLLRLAEGFARDGLEVVVIVHTMDTAELPLPPGVTLRSLGCRGTLGAPRKLAAALRELRPRWLLAGFPHTNLVAVLAARWAGTGCKVVVSEHAPLSHQIRQQAQWRYWLLPPLLRWAYRRAHAVVAVSGGVRDDLRTLVGADLQPHVIGNPVLDDSAPVVEATPLHPWLRNPTLQVVLSVSRLSPEKNLPVLLQAFALLHARRPAARLLLAGDGPEARTLAAEITRLGLADVVQLVGRVRQPMAWMRSAAAVALASSFEGFGNVLVEALASGTPVVSTDCPVGPREILDHGRWGELVPVGDATALSQALERTLARGHAPEGAQAHAQRFTIAAASAAYRRVFEGAVPTR